MKKQPRGFRPDQGKKNVTEPGAVATGPYIQCAIYNLARGKTWGMRVSALLPLF
ncbi:MAG TPA: hypothetical protein VN920_03895 [Pyrinomonadaceae bacterium]|nr:hypothetical protein [Pyrinomonadaceae bacterium]